MKLFFTICVFLFASVSAYSQEESQQAQSQEIMSCKHYDNAPPSKNYIRAMCDLPDGATNIKSVEYTFKLRGTIVKNSIKETNFRNRRGWTYAIAGPRGSQFEYVQVMAYTERRQPYGGEPATMIVRSLVFGGELTNQNDD